MAKNDVLQYSPANHPAWHTDKHDMAQASRVLSDGTSQMRMECKCGSKSRWSETYGPTISAKNRHADNTA